MIGLIRCATCHKLAAEYDAEIRYPDGTPRSAQYHCAPCSEPTIPEPPPWLREICEPDPGEYGP